MGHIGYTPEKGFSVQNSGPEWNGLFDQLKDLGFTAEDINESLFSSYCILHLKAQTKDEIILS